MGREVEGGRMREEGGARWTGDRAAGLGDFSNHVSAKGKNGHQSQSRSGSDFRLDFQTRFLE